MTMSLCLHASRLTRLPMLALLVALLGTAACGTSAEGPGVPSPDGWQEFTGSWSAAGTRRDLQMGEGRRARQLDMRGSLMLSGASRPSVGFRAEVLVLSDSVTGLVGRSAWTDANGDQVFSELHGGGPGGDDRIVGTVVGGTGRYAGVTGEYSFGWRFVLESEDGTVQGNAIDFHGRVHRDATASAQGARP